MATTGEKRTVDLDGKPAIGVGEIEAPTANRTPAAVGREHELARGAGVVENLDLKREQVSGRGATAAELAPDCGGSHGVIVPSNTKERRTCW